MTIAQSHAQTPSFTDYRDVLDFRSFQRQCLLEKPNYDSLKHHFELQMKSIPDKLLAFQRDSLGRQPIPGSVVSTRMNIRAYLSDRIFQAHAMAASRGTTARVEDSLLLVQKCAEVLVPRSTKYLLKEDKPRPADFDFNTNQPVTNWDNAFKTRVYLTEAKWVTYEASFWAKASWNGKSTESIMIEAPVGTQICDVEYEESGRGNRKVELRGFTPSNSDLSDKIIGLEVKGKAFGENEWHDQKSAKVIVKITKVKLVPFEFGSLQRADAGCKNFSAKTGKQRVNATDWSTNSPGGLTKKILESFPENYPLDLGNND